MTASNSPTIRDVKSFWEDHPLWSGESRFQPGSQAFFEEHRRVYIEDCFAGRLDPRTFPPPANRGRVLDLGCGPGFWTTEFLRESCADKVVAADLTEQAVALTGKRLALYGLSAETQVENAESLSFPDNSFTHVNCQGVIHHTPDTAKAVAEIARVLQPGGTASLSVYYRNWVLRNWRWLRSAGNLLRKSGARLEGRGREAIYGLDDIDTIVRHYDGGDNPVGKHYSKSEFLNLLAPHFEVREIYFHFFPARSLPVRIPKPVHRLLDAKLPFMMYANVTKIGSA